MVHSGLLIGPWAHEAGPMTADISIPTPQPNPITRAAQGMLRILPGLGLTAALAAVATILGQLMPTVGGPVIGILLGIGAAATLPQLRSAQWSPGVAFAARPVLQGSIVVLGTGLSLSTVLHVGVRSLPVMAGSLVVSLVGARVIGRWLGVDRDARTLIGIGTGICGASAIAASTAVLKPKQADVAYAMGTIFIFNITAVLLFPPIGHLLGMTGASFGLWSGTAVNDMSSVVASAVSFGDSAAQTAVVVKLTRSLMIIPIVMTLAVLTTRRERTNEPEAGRQGTTGRRLTPRSLPWGRLVPLFLVGFVVAATINTIGGIPAGWHPGLSSLGTYLITIALSGIGLTIRPREMRAAGHRPLLLGGILWACVSLTSLGLQALTGSI